MIEILVDADNIIPRRDAPKSIHRTLGILVLSSYLSAPSCLTTMIHTFVRWWVDGFVLEPRVDSASA